MRKTLTAAALVFVFSCSAWGGIMHTPPVASDPDPTPTPPSTAALQEPATTDEDAAVATDTLTQIVLTVLASVLP